MPDHFTILRSKGLRTSCKKLIYLKLTSCKKRNTKKASQINDVPINYIKELEIFSLQLYLKITMIASTLVSFRNVLKLLIFPECFKSSLHVRKTNLQKRKTNYKAISIFSKISKIYERHDNMSDHFNDVLSKCQFVILRKFYIWDGKNIN